MKILVLWFFVLFVGVVVMFWHSSYKGDRDLQEIYTHPRGAVVPSSIESATAEIKNSYELQLDLVTLVHRMYIYTQETAISAILFTLPILFFALRNSKRVPNQSPDPAPTPGMPPAGQEPRHG